MSVLVGQHYWMTACGGCATTVRLRLLMGDSRTSLALFRERSDCSVSEACCADQITQRIKHYVMATYLFPPFPFFRRLRLLLLRRRVPKAGFKVLSAKAALAALGLDNPLRQFTFLPAFLQPFLEPIFLAPTVRSRALSSAVFSSMEHSVGAMVLDKLSTNSGSLLERIEVLDAMHSVSRRNGFGAGGPADLWRGRSGGRCCCSGGGGGGCCVASVLDMAPTSTMVGIASTSSMLGIASTSIHRRLPMGCSHTCCRGVTRRELQIRRGRWW